MLYQLHTRRVAGYNEGRESLIKLIEQYNQPAILKINRSHH